MPGHFEITLRQHLDKNEVDVPSFLTMAIGMAELAGKHPQAGQMKKMLSPDHIVYNPETGQFKLLDLPTLPTANLNSKYAYMSPEQTGRMNRKIDNRSYLYVLGIIYYEMLTGSLPFKADTAAEWVFTHMAIRPEPLRIARPTCPQIICDIVMKLLSKPVEERYQSAYGLLLDLEHCMEEWRINGRIDPFVLGQSDALIRFQIPQTLYGKGKDTGELLSAFERIRAGGMELMVISGTAGSGKTMLVKEFQMTVLKEKGYFIAGKMDQLRRDIPYGPFIQAFKDLMRQILAESPEQIASWQRKLLQALGHSGAVIAEVIPEVSLIIGKQQSIEALPPADATNRFQQLFLNFIRVFASREHPLVLFLDDLQWADLASLRFLRILLNVARNWNLLLIATCRDNEINDGHPLREILDEEIRRKDSVLHSIKMEALNLSEVQLFISETLHSDPENIRPLAEVLFQKTAGNPFYLAQMMQSVYNDKLIYFNEKSIRWEWDLGPIKDREGFNDVIQLIVERFNKLPERTRFVLRMAGCIGNTFALSQLSMVCEQSLQQTERDLSLALYEGLVLTSNETDLGVQQPTYTFLHDRVQQAIYDLLPETEAKEIHLKIGRIMLSQGLIETSDDFLLETAYQLNLGSEFIAELVEKRKLAEINLRAGIKAKASAAYDTALVLLKAGVELLQDEGWSMEDNSLFFNLLLERSECEYYCGNFAQAEEILEQLMQHTHTLMDWANLYHIQITMYSFQNKNEKAMEVAIRAMAEFGLNIPLKPTRVSVIGELLRTWLQVKRRVDQWGELPQTQDPHHKALTSIVIAAASSVTIANPLLSVILFSKYVRRVLKNGDAEGFSFALSSYALLLCLGFSRYKTAFRLVEKILPYAQKLESIFIKGRVFQIIGMILLFNRPKDSNPYFKQGLVYNLESGDLVSIGYGVTLDVTNCTGDLRELYHLCADYEEMTSRILDPVTTRLLQKTKQFILVLQGRTIEPFADVIRDDELFSEMNIWIRNHYYSCYTWEMETRYVFGYYVDVIELAERSKKWEEKKHEIYIRKQCFYKFLAMAAHYVNIPIQERRKYLRLLDQELRRMKKWTKTAPEGALDKYLLMSAEMARLKGKDKQVMQRYDQAVVSAKASGVYQYEAIACELAARYYLSQEKERMAEVYFRDACRGYVKWGAIGKAKSLCDSYPGWLSEFSEADSAWINDDWVADTLPEAIVHKESLLSFEEAAAADNTIGKELDLSTIRQAAKIISDGSNEENQNFLALFLDLALSNAGAERGFIVMEKDGELIVNAKKDVNRSRGSVQSSVHDEGDFSMAVIQFVLRTQEPVVLGEAKWSMFALDPYISRVRPRSILCLPVLYPDNRVGAVYLENNLTADAFTADRLEVLDMVFSRMVYLKSLQRQGGVNEETGEISEMIQVKSQPTLIESLTKREMEILHLMADGLSNKEIALLIQVTEGTVKNHAINIYGKLQVKRRVQAITKARELLLLE
jgi:predicted ATPase/DNA-binding CsgD family transcriptional regulator/GAF domain-containing protein